MIWPPAARPGSVVADGVYSSIYVVVTSRSTHWNRTRYFVVARRPTRDWIRGRHGHGRVVSGRTPQIRTWMKDES